MLKWLKKIWKRIFKKNKLKPIKNPKYIDIVCQGYFSAPDAQCNAYKLKD